MNLIKKLKRPSIAVFIDAFIVINAYVLASLILFANGAPADRYKELIVFISCAVVVHCTLNRWFGIYRYVGRYVGFHQALKIVEAAALSVAGLMLITFITEPASAGHALVMIPIGGFLVMIFFGGIRFYPRIFYERSLRNVVSQVNILVVGAGDAGERIVRNIQNDHLIPMNVVAVVDDDPAMIGKEMHGVSIFGPIEKITRVVEKKNIDEILIAIPSATIEQFSHIWEVCSQCDIPVKTVGSLQSTHFGEVDVKRIRDIRIEDVLGRQPVQTDYAQIGEFIQGKTVVVTGAGGSIGSELVLQISQHNPGKIILIDQDETALYTLHERLMRYHFQQYDMFVADIKSEKKMESIFDEYQPNIVFHAAAYKHVPLMELHPDEGVLNNVMGTLNMATISGRYGVESFVNISTDKAVEPVNILGATKRLGERIVAEMENLYEDTLYCSVRFGNVLGSRGSVIPIFREQIHKGGPVTVTDPQMTRYFMMISEAVDLVLQAAAFQKGNAIYVLDMGKPVKIVALAEKIIEFMKSEEKIEMVYTGLRPGEKLHETLFESCENSEASGHERIYRVNPFHWGEALILDRLPQLFDEARANNHAAIRRLLKEWIPTYRPFEMENIGLVTDEATEVCADAVGEVSYAGGAFAMTGGLNYAWSISVREDDTYDGYEGAKFVERRKQRWSSYERTIFIDRRRQVSESQAI